MAHNNTFDRTAGSHSLATAGQRARSTDETHHRPLAELGKEVSWTRTLM